MSMKVMREENDQIANSQLLSMTVFSFIEIDTHKKREERSQTNSQNTEWRQYIIQTHPLSLNGNLQHA